MLELIQDNRSGNRLELVVFTFDEERRIRPILQYYGSRFDVVLLDGGSSDRTIEIALVAHATVFRRLGAVVGESYFAHYVKDVTRSGLCFYLFADEFIPKAELEAIETELRLRASAVLCSKSEWFYGRRMLTFNHIEPRGFRKGCAKYIEHLHENLQVVESPGAPTCRHLFTLNHAHIWSVQSYFGKVGIYSDIEIEEFRKSGHTGPRFFRRYIATWIGFPLIKVWRERGIGVPRALFWFLFDLAELVIAALTWIEHGFLISPEDQLTQYSKFFTDETSAPTPKDKTL